MCIRAYCKDCENIKSKQWKLKNSERNKNYGRKYNKEYYKNNRPYFLQKAYLAHNRKKEAQPKWLDEFELLWLDEIYDLARLRRLEVDHIIPLNSKTVCGLHVPWNLQLLPMLQNRQKGNKYDNHSQ